MRDDQELLEFPIDRGELLHDSGYEEGNGWAQMPRFLPRSPEQRAAWRAYLGQYVDTWVGYREQHLPPLLRPIFVHRWLPSFCMLEYLTVIAFLCVHLGVFAGSLFEKNFKESAKKLGGLLQADLIFILLLGLRNTPAKWAIGMSSEKLAFWHGLLSNSFLLYAALHGVLAAVYYWDNPGLLELVYDSENLMGLLSFSCFALVVLLSLPPVRRHAWELFRVAHMLVVPALIFSFFHHGGTDMVGILFIFLLPYAVDLSLRFKDLIFKEPSPRLVSAHVHGTLIKVQLTAPHIAAYPGCWLLLNVPSLAGLQQHPFSVARQAPGANRVITCYIRGRGDWTHQLIESHEKLANTRVVLEGPYGHLKFPLLSYSRVFLFAAGSALSPMLSILQAFREGAPEHQQVTIVWSVRYAGELALFREDIERDASPSEDWRIFITGEDEWRDVDATELSVNKAYYPGRPDPVGLLNNFRTSCHRDPHPSATAALYVAGPQSFVDCVSQAAAILNSQTNRLLSSTFRFEVIADQSQL